ncbi:PREDICTED: homeobox-leucine zipper protein HDG9-like [Camelina sativa]|uniref:Homeobox-leucine zipper protein HDG9-like n=1 Tax=Camelina sativa TaxID=90675 RepID=A0ABM0T3Q8_CAMSA|nr:PREDICTED: homeobox-leucine zipper protein HDG9-like [Camelina sativa]
MDSSRDDSSSDERGNSTDTNNNQDRRNYHRHTNQQIQRLEAYFKECPHPDDLQRRQLGEELNLKPKQIKFWFQNKRTQAKSHNERESNAVLRAENMRMRRENATMEDALKNVVCGPCGGRGFGREEKQRNIQKLRAENAFLKSEFERFSNFLAQRGGHSMPSVGAFTYPHGPSTSNNRRASYGTSSNHLPQPSCSLRGPYARGNISINQPHQLRKEMPLQHFPPLSQMEKLVMFETAEKAVAEVMNLIQMEELWKKSSIDDRLVIDPTNYEKCFAKISHFKGPSGRSESSKEVVVVQTDARILVDMFLDTEKWARLFPTIVNEAKNIRVLDSMDNGRQTLARVIYEQMHILSPLVPPREFIILRSCQQMEENVWMIADVSCNLPNVAFESMAPICTKHPSGVLIESLPNGCSKVTWIEHVEVTDKTRPHRLYRDLFLYGGLGYGARRWTVTLEKMCERLYLSSISDFPNNDYAGVVQTIEGRRSVMKLGERMLKDFAWMIKMEKKLDFSQQSETNSSGVTIAMRLNNEAGQPPGLILCAGSSLCLPLPPPQVYDFLRNLNIRHQWDVLCNGNPVTEVARFVTGTDKKNNVNFIETSSGGDNNSNLMILQDGSIDALGGMVVYAPMGLETAAIASAGQVDPSTIPILPSGFIISRDGRPSSAEDPDGGSSTLLTVAFQILVCDPNHSAAFNVEESAATVNNVISSTVQRIKAMLNCD